MTRKRYVKKLWALTTAIYRHPASLYPEGTQLGEMLKHNRDFAKSVPENCGSYNAAWNSGPMKWVREYYGVH